MRDAEWYVMQVQTGNEPKMVQLARQAGERERINGREPILEECFFPLYETQRKYKGQWQTVERPLIPGYIIAVTRRPDALAQALYRVPWFARVLTMGETFVPLNEAERVWLQDFTKKNDRVVPMSVAVKVGDKITVTEGPLKGREGLIEKVNRSKSLAILKFDVGGKRMTMRVGLAILNGDKTPDATTVGQPADGRNRNS